MKMIKLALCLLGIATFLITARDVWGGIVASRHGYVVPNWYWLQVLVWPASMANLELWRFPVAGFTAILAMIWLGKLGYGGEMTFVVLGVILFPFLAMLVAFFPPLLAISPEKRERVLGSMYYILGGLVLIGGGLYSWFVPSSDVVYIVGARWFASDNPLVMAIVGAVLVGGGVFLGIRGILVLLGSEKP